MTTSQRGILACLENISAKYYPIPNSIVVERSESRVVFNYFELRYSDERIIPERLKEAKIYDVRIRLIEAWIAENVFYYMYEHADKLDVKTTDVRIRIAINQINKIPGLSKDTKLYWIEWLCELYKARMKARMDYYLKHIVKLPF